MGQHHSSGAGVALLAAAAGFVAGILLAPKSGAETRKDVKRQAKKYQKEATRGLDIAKDTFEASRKELKTVADEVVKDARELSSDAKVRAKRTAEHAKTSAHTVEGRARQAWGSRPDQQTQKK